MNFKYLDLLQLIGNYEEVFKFVIILASIHKAMYDN